MRACKPDHPDGRRHTKVAIRVPGRMNPLLDTPAIDANISGMQQVFEKYLSMATLTSDAIMLNNAELADNLNYLEFLRDIGRHFQR